MKSIEQKVKEMIIWIEEEADDDDINFLYDYITNENRNREHCPSPLNKFYRYLDEVPEGARVSTSEDCETCRRECNNAMCLIKPGSYCFPDK